MIKYFEGTSIEQEKGKGSHTCSNSFSPILGFVFRNFILAIVLALMLFYKSI